MAGRIGGAGTGFGILGDIIVGIVGAIIGGIILGAALWNRHWWDILDVPDGVYWRGDSDFDCAPDRWQHAPPNLLVHLGVRLSTIKRARCRST